MLIEQTSTPLFHFKLEEGHLQMVIVHNKRGQYGIIENVFVEEKFRRRGVATRLVAEAVELAKKLGLYKITLTCNKSLVDFYKYRGFEWKENGQAYCMRMNLDGV